MFHETFNILNVLMNKIKMKQGLSFQKALFPVAVLSTELEGLQCVHDTTVLVCPIEMCRPACRIAYSHLAFADCRIVSPFFGDLYEQYDAEATMCFFPKHIYRNCSGQQD